MGVEIRRVCDDLYFVEWGNVRMGGTFAELSTFAAELQSGMTKALAGDPEQRWEKPLHLIGYKNGEPMFNASTRKGPR